MGAWVWDTLREDGSILTIVSTLSEGAIEASRPIWQ